MAPHFIIIIIVTGRFCRCSNNININQLTIFLSSVLLDDLWRNFWLQQITLAAIGFPDDVWHWQRFVTNVLDVVVQAVGILAEHLVFLPLEIEEHFSVPNDMVHGHHCQLIQPSVLTVVAAVLSCHLMLAQVWTPFTDVEGNTTCQIVDSIRPFTIQLVALAGTLVV